MPTCHSAALGLGDSGSLLGPWHDPDAMALLLRLSGAGPFGWCRDQGFPDRLLTSPVLGVRAVGPTPEDLMDGLEALAALANRYLPQVQTAIGPDGDLAHGLTRLLRHLLALDPRFALCDGGVGEGRLMPLDERGTVVEDHR